MTNQNGVAVPHNAPSPPGPSTAGGRGALPPRGTLTQLWNATGSESETLAAAFPGIPEDTTFEKLMAYFASRRLDTAEQKIDEEFDRLKIRDEARRRFDAEQADTTDPLTERILHRDQLADIPALQPLIDNTIDMGTVAGLFGYWGTGKSFLAIDWAACIATGKSWQARPVTQRKVLYVAAEGIYGLDARLAAWEAAWRHTIEPDTLHVLPHAINLTKALEVARLAELITTEQYGVVIIDTLARSIVGADENSAKDMGIVVNHLYALRDAGTDTTIIPIHHTGKDKQTVRGSSALESGLDTIYLTEGDGHHIKLTRTKRKDGPVEDTMNLRIEPIPTTNSAIIRYQGEDVRGQFDGGKSTQLLSAYLSTFSGTGASKAELRAVANMPPSTFHRALSALVDEGRLINTGSDQRPFYKQAPT